MSDPVDFNIDNYSIKDLLTIFEIKKPMNKTELTEFMDEFKRPFSFLQQLPGSSVTVPVARWINNLWELDINLREIWNRGPQPKYEQANPIPSYP